MAGCFGNSFFDRSMESQLNAHLRQEDEWTEYCDAVSEKVPSELWNSGFCDWFQTNECNDLLIKIQFDSDDLTVIADRLIQEYSKTK